jgi:hypothetical protein
LCRMATPAALSLIGDVALGMLLMSDPDKFALTRIIEYAKRESESQGREFTAYLLGLASESLAEQTAGMVEAANSGGPARGSSGAGLN